MIDLETMGLGEKAAVIQIGACYFDMEGNIGDRFSVNVSLESEVVAGFTLDPSTIMWWMLQSEEARQLLFNPTPLLSFEAFNELNTFLKPSTELWSHATFDFVILMSHFNHYGLKGGTHWREARDLRTLVKLAHYRNEQEDLAGSSLIKHNALHDCFYQVHYAVKCLNRLKGDFHGGT